jgi:hypothetical protein
MIPTQGAPRGYTRSTERDGRREEPVLATERYAVYSYNMLRAIVPVSHEIAAVLSGLLPKTVKDANIA